MGLITTTLKIFEVLNSNPVSALLFPCNCMLHFMVKAQGWTHTAGQKSEKPPVPPCKQF